MPAVSVIVPVYKVEEYLERCVDSILMQTFYDMEVILVDDGSPDSCGKICDEYATKDKRVKVVHKENGGLSSARNAGLQDVEGNYVLFVDSDDWIEPDMIEAMYNEANTAKADLVVCNYKKVFDDHIEKGCLKLVDGRVDVEAMGLEAYMFKYILPYTHGDEVWNKLYAANIIKENGISFELNHDIFSEDMLFNFYYLCHVKRISALNRDFYNYLQRNNSIVFSKRPELPKQYAALFTRFIGYYRRQGRLAEIKKAVPYILYILMFVCVNRTAKGEDYDLGVFAHFSNIAGYSKYMKLVVCGYGEQKIKNLTGFPLKVRVKIRILSLLLYLKMFKAAVLLEKVKIKQSQILG